MHTAVPPCRPPRLTPARLFGVNLPPAPHRDLDPAVAREFLREFRTRPLDWSVLAPQIRYSGLGYYRKRLHRNSRWELLLLCWLPGQYTVIHDHGESYSATRIISGVMSEIVYECRGEGKRMKRLATRSLAAGRVTLEPVGAIHKVFNDTTAPAASLHLYSPPLKELGSYDEATGRRRSIIPDRGPDEAVGGAPIGEA